MRRTGAGVACAVALLAASCEGTRGDDLARRVTIYRDVYGVPHVFGETDAATTFGFGYAQAEDGFFRLEDNYIRALGRRAEVDGERRAGEDRLNRVLRIPHLARVEYRRLPRRIRDLVDGYAAGVNFWMARHPERRPRLLTRIEPWYVLAFIRYNYFQNGFVWSSGVAASELSVAARETGAVRNTGSNGWVVGPSRTANGHALLFINPHLPFFGPGQTWEGQVHSASGWDFTGYTRLGFPLPYVGHGNAIGWVSTDNAADQADLYAETFDDPSRPLAYRYGAAYRMATEWLDTIFVRTPTGLEARVLTLRRTHHGPIVGTRDGKPLALRMAKLEAGGWLEEWYAMTRARSVGELRSALRPLAMLFGNVMAADTAGSILYVYNAAVPRRDPRIDWSGVVDGSDPATEWQGYHALDELPQLTDPASGWMQNCNTSPFLLTDQGNPDPGRFPPYMVTEGDNLRGQAARRILAGTRRFTWDEWARAAFDTRVIGADSMLPRMTALLTARGDRAARMRWAPPLAVLGRWNHRADTASVATTLFALWVEMADDLAGSRPGEEDVVSDAFDSVLVRLGRDFGTWRVPWGEVNRLQRYDEADGTAAFSDDRPSIAVPGVSGSAGAIFTFYARRQRGQRRRYGTAGGTYVSVVEFAPTVRALAVHVFGTGGGPDAPHWFDQAPLYARGAFRGSWLLLDDIRANLEQAYRPGEESP